MSKESIISKQVISTIESRDKFLAILKNMNPGIFILKLGAKWCGPCKKIEGLVNTWFQKMPDTVQPAIIDVDECFELYGFLKTKKRVNGIPVMLCYKKGNKTFIPDDSITGSHPEDLHNFFMRCGKHLTDAIKLNPK